MITRQQYLGNSKELHRKYYAQFTTKHTSSVVVSCFGLNELAIALVTDKHLNTISLHEWDRLSYSVEGDKSIRDKLKEAGDLMSLASAVCILKESAQIAVEKAWESGTLKKIAPILVNLHYNKKNGVYLPGMEKYRELNQRTT